MAVKATVIARTRRQLPHLLHDHARLGRGMLRMPQILRDQPLPRQGHDRSRSAPAQMAPARAAPGSAAGERRALMPPGAAVMAGQTANAAGHCDHDPSV
jgi:hypothetical protein